MKAVLKVFALGAALIAANRLCCALFGELSVTITMLLSAVVFLITASVFLISESISALLIRGFCGAFLMFFGEIVFIFCDIFLPKSFNTWSSVYLGGFYGSIGAVVLSVILTLKKVSLPKIFKEGGFMANEISKNAKIKLLAYALLTAMSFSYTVMPENSALGVAVFALVQFILLWFTVPDRKRLIFFIPIFVMCLNSFISASTIWHIPNFVICIIAYSCMFTPMSLSSDSLGYISHVLENIVRPMGFLSMPFKWVLELNSDKAPVIKRIALALVISIPCAMLLIFILANADMVFSLKTELLFNRLFGLMSLRTVFIILCGTVVGLYLFGVLCRAHLPDKARSAEEAPPRKGDMIIINTLLFVSLAIYTLFAVIQFKYLFAGSTLPEGITYSAYARKGFFELLALTGVNIAAILTVTRLTKAHTGKWKTVSKVLCHYLCAVTLVLLASSFYRMMLYTQSDGLTRLRFFVIGFLFFEAAGLLITFFYIARPKFNISLVYFALALTYYMVLNLVPADLFIANNQVEKYLAGERENIDYVFTLSADAAPAIAELYSRTDNIPVKATAKVFLERKTFSDIPRRWQRYNLSTERAYSILQSEMN